MDIIEEILCLEQDDAFKNLCLELVFCLFGRWKMI